MAKVVRTILSVVIQNTESLHENTDFRSNENQEPESFRNFVVRSIKNDENILIKHRNRYGVRRHARRGDAPPLGERHRPVKGQADAPYPTYVQLQQEESYLETRQDSLDSQISLMENEISSLKNLVNTNIKSSCTLNLIGN